MAETSIELRGECAREIVDVIDAVSQARRMTRTQLINEILGDWVRQKLHEVKVVQRVARGNPALTERVGSLPE